MRRIIHLFSLLCLLVAPAFQAVAQQQEQYAVFNYRNDGRFNAFLNIDIDSITYSCIDTLGIEHDDVVVQEVWTPDSLFRIPLDAVDSLAFRAPETKVRDNLFYLRDYHADNCQGVDSLTIWFSTAIDNDSLPAIGQVAVAVTEKTPFEEGFAGRVVKVNRLADRIEVVSAQATLFDVFERLATVGAAVSDLEGYKSMKRRAPRRSGYWDELEASGTLREIEVPGEWKIPILDLYTMTSKTPMVECRYYALINLWDYYIDADVYIHHNDLTQTITFDWDKIKKKGDEYSKVKAVWNMLEKGDIQGIQDAEAALEEKEWEEKVKIPFKAGLFNFSIELGGMIKPLAMDLKWTTTIKSKAFQHLGFRCKGYVTNISYLATYIDNLIHADSWDDALPPLKHDVEGTHTMTMFPFDSFESDLKFSGSVSAGVFARFNVSLLTKHLIRATIGAEAGVKLEGTLDLKLASSDYQKPDLYTLFSDTNIEAKIYTKFKAEAGALPFNLIGMAWEKEIPIVGDKFYFVPHFTKPTLTSELTYQRMQNETFTTTVSRKLFPLFNCYPGLGVYSQDSQGKWNVAEAMFYDAEPYGFDWYDLISQYKPDRDVAYSIFASGLQGGQPYRVYPVFRMFGFTWKGEPYTDFTYPKPLALENPSTILQEGVPQLVRIEGGWGDYEVSVDHPEVATAELLTLGNFSQVRLSAVTSGTATVTVRDKRSLEKATIAVKVFGDPEDGAAITLSASTLDMGTHPFGSRTTQSFTVTNHGSVELCFKVDKSQANLDNGIVVDGAGEVLYLQPGASKAFSVTANGIGPGHYRMGTVYVYSNATKDPASVLVKVTGTAPQAEYVDLGLPSGTKWATFNLGALEASDSNVGEFIAWGETDSKASYSWDNYKHCSGTEATCQSLGDISGTDYDAARYQWGDEWRIPTADEMRELREQCTWTWDDTGFYPGYWVKGPNGKRIFMEAAGYADGETVMFKNTGGAYMTGSPYESDLSGAYVMAFDKDARYVDAADRYKGVSIRPVYGNISTLELSATTLSVAVGQRGEVSVTSGSGSYAAVSSDTDIAGVEVSGSTIYVKGVAPGTATVTVKDNATQERAAIAVTVTEASPLTPGEAIDLGLPSGTLWASCNVGANSPEEYGGYYAWGETEEKDVYNWSTYKWMNEGQSSWSQINKYTFADGQTSACWYRDGTFIGDGKTTLDPEDDVATVKWGSGWQMPTREQMEELYTQCSSEWITLNGVYGRKFTGPNGNSIFLPAAGYRDDTSLRYAGSGGNYWSRSLKTYDSDSAYDLYFDSGYIYWGNSRRSRGQSVRPVRVPN